MQTCRNKRKSLSMLPVPSTTDANGAWFVLEPIVNGERAKWGGKTSGFERLGTSTLRSHPEVRKEAAPKGSN